MGKEADSPLPRPVPGPWCSEAGWCGGRGRIESFGDAGGRRDNRICPLQSGTGAQLNTGLDGAWELATRELEACGEPLVPLAVGGRDDPLPPLALLEVSRAALQRARTPGGCGLERGSLMAPGFHSGPSRCRTGLAPPAAVGDDDGHGRLSTR